MDANVRAFRPSSRAEPQLTLVRYRKLNVPGSYLHSLDFYIYVDMTSLDWEDWKVLTWVYNHQVFKSVEALVAAWKDGTLVRSQKVRLNDTDWATRTPKGVKRDLDHLAGPRSVMVRCFYHSSWGGADFAASSLTDLASARTWRRTILLGVRLSLANESST